MTRLKSPPKMVREQQADFIIKGSVHTDELMGVLIDKTKIYAPSAV